MKQMKRIVMIALAAVLLLALVGCGGTTAEKNTAESAEALTGAEKTAESGKASAGDDEKNDGKTPVTGAGETEEKASADAVLTVEAEPASMKRFRESEKAFDVDSALPENQTTVGMTELFVRYAGKWKELALEYEQKIMAYDGIPAIDGYYTAQDLHSFVSSMQQNWERYYDEQCDLYLKTLQTIYGSGTIVGPAMAGYCCEMQKGWAEQLAEICRKLSLD